MSLKMLEQTAPPASPKAVPPVIAQGSFRRQDFGTTVWVHAPGNHLRFPQLLEPTYWGPIAREVRAGDRIEVLPEDGTYFAELLVRSTIDKSVRVHVLRHVELPDESVAETKPELTVLYRGPVKRYCIMDGSRIVQDGFETADSAMEEIPSARL